MMWYLKAMNNWDILMLQLTFMVFVPPNLIVEKCWEPHFPIKLAIWGYAPFSDRAILMEKTHRSSIQQFMGFSGPEKMGDNPWGPWTDRCNQPSQYEQRVPRCWIKTSCFTMIFLADGLTHLLFYHDGSHLGASAKVHPIKKSPCGCRFFIDIFGEKAWRMTPRFHGKHEYQ